MSSAISEFSGGTELLYGAELLWEIKRKGKSNTYEESGSYSIGTFAQYSQLYRELVFLASYSNTASSQAAENETKAGYLVVPMKQIAFAIEHYNYLDHPTGDKLTNLQKFNIYVMAGTHSYPILINIPAGDLNVTATRSQFTNASSYNYGIFRMYGKV